MLRLDNDWINHLVSTSETTSNEITNNLFNSYIKAMEKYFSTDDKIYISTHLLKSNNQNNYLIDIIKQKYNVITSIPWRDNFKLPIEREIDAIIDYLLCINADKFIGYEGSTFSSNIAYLSQSDNKTSVLI